MYRVETGEKELTRYEQESKHEDENSIPSLPPVTIFTSINEKSSFKVLAVHNLCRHSIEKNPKAKKIGKMEESRRNKEIEESLKLKLTCHYFSIIQMSICCCYV